MSGPLCRTASHATKLDVPFEEYREKRKKATGKVRKSNLNELIAKT